VEEVSFVKTEGNTFEPKAKMVGVGKQSPKHYPTNKKCYVSLDYLTIPHAASSYNMV